MRMRELARTISAGLRRLIAWWRYEPQTVFGFDLVANQLRWVRLTRKFRAWELSGFGIRNLAPTPDYDEEDKEREMLELLRELNPAERRVSSRCYLTTYGAGVFFRHFTVPTLNSSAEEASAVAWEARKQIPVPLDNTYWTYRTVDRAVGAELRVEVMFVAVLRSVVDRLAEVFAAAGTRLHGVALGGAGFVPVLPVLPGSEQDAVGLLEITPRSSFLTFFGRRGIEFFREFSATGLTRAELDAGHLGRFLEPIRAEVLSSLDFYQGQYAMRRPTHLFLAGIPEGELDIAAGLSGVVSSEVSVLTPPEHLSYAVEDPAEFALLYPFFAKALGAALARDRSDYLVPAATQRADRSARWNRLILEMAFPAAAMLALVHGAYLSELSGVRAAVRREEAELARLREQPGIVEAAGLQGEIQGEAAYLAQFVHDPPVLSWCLTELSNVTPAGVTLERLKLVPQAGAPRAVPPTRIEIAGWVVGSGGASELALVNFVHRLEESPFFGEAKVLSRSEEGREGRETTHFTLELVLR